jgi:HK97 family phage portal protein
MLEPIYSLALTRSEDGTTFTKAAPSSGFGSFDPVPLGAPYSDVFRKSRAPAPRELIQQLVGTAYACAALNADLLATTRLRLYLRTRPGEARAKAHCKPMPVSRKALAHLKEDPAAYGFVAGDVLIEQVTHHPLLDLLKRPSPDPDQPGLCGYDLRWMTQLYLESAGRAYWLVERDGLGVPMQLWLLRPHLVREVPDLTGRKIIDHYQYGGARGARYAPSEIIKFHFPDPDNPYIGGYSPLAAAIEKIRISRKEDAHLNAMLENMGRPDAVWSPRGDSEGGGIGAAEASRVRSAFRQAFSMAGRGGLLVSEYPGSIQPLQWSPQDVVEIERAKAIKTDICNVFGVPDAKLERNAASLAAAKTADYAHTKDAGIPRCARNEETLNARLVPLFDPSGRLFLAYDSPVREDEIFALEQTRTAGLTGAITRNEVRASVGLDPVSWGEQPLVPNNMVEVDPETGRPEHFDPNAMPAPAPILPETDASSGGNAKALDALAAGQQALADAQMKLATALEAMGRNVACALEKMQPRLPDQQPASNDGVPGTESTEATKGTETNPESRREEVSPQMNTDEHG